MIEAIRIRNYKSVVDMKVRFGQVNVFIGENGSGKSNILEAMTMAAAAEKNELSKGYLVSRGVRIIDDAELMNSNFHESAIDQPIILDLYPTKTIGVENPKDMARQEYSVVPYLLDDSFIRFKLTKKKLFKLKGELVELGNTDIDKHYQKTKEMHSKLEQTADKLKSASHDDFNRLSKIFSEKSENRGEEFKELSKPIIDSDNYDELIQKIMALIPEEEIKKADEYENVRDSVINDIDEELAPIKDFVVFSPENTALRNFYKEGQIEPLGINGEGLLRTLRSLRLKEKPMEDLEEALSLFGWYDSFSIPENLSDTEDKIYIKDKFIRSEFDQRSANEGFLFVLFYIALIVSESTPKVFAIDNVDASLNPKLCRKLMEVISKLAEEYGKQVFLTTHNPAILDGIDLKNEKNKLFVVSRDYDGQTIVKPVSKDKNFKEANGKEMKFSEAFLRGYIGGLPKGF